MRVTSIAVFANESQTLKFDLRNASAQSKYVVRNILGLDAEEIIPRFYGFSKDGSKRFYDFKLPPRELVIRLTLNPRFNLNETYSEVRDDIYRAISATRTGELEFQFQVGAATVAKISGHVIKMEVAHFSSNPELQITVRCEDPIFRGTNPVEYAVADLATTNPVGIVDNLSTAPHGFKASFTMTATAASLTVQDKAIDPEWEFKIIPASSFLSGDVIHFSSEVNNRYLYMDRASVITSLMDMIEPSSVVPIMFPGFNEFHFVEIASFDWNELSFTPAYWGV